MTNYASHRVNELRELLSKRKLPQNGKKEELIARLEAADREDAAATSTPTAPAGSTPAADAVAHLLSAEEYEINWDEDDTTATGPKSARPVTEKSEPQATEVKQVVVSGGTEQPKTVGTADGKVEEHKQATAAAPAQGREGRKPFTFKRLAEQFTDLPSTKKPENRKSTDDKNEKEQKAKDTPTPTTSIVEKREKPEETLKPAPAKDVDADADADAKPAESFTAGLAPTPLEVELEKRKARAARFGAEQVDPGANESLKKLERVARFGGTNAGGTAASKEESVGVQGLDQALPERKRRAGDYGSSGRGGGPKRPRFHGGAQRRQGGGDGHGHGHGHGHGNGGANGGEKRNGSAQGGREQKKQATGKSVLDDPAEREKAEKRRNRFGAQA